MSRHHVHAATVVALVLAASLPPALGVAGIDGEPSDIIDVCFTVTNAVGWPLEGVNFTAVRTDISTPGATTHVTTGPDGLVRVALIRSSYSFLLRDDLTAASPLRNGAVYLPTNPTDFGFTLPGEGGLTPDACGEGLEGYVFRTGVEVMTSPPTQGYLQIEVRDVAAAAAPPLPNARIASPTLQEDNSTGALTDAAGIARLACIGGAASNLVVTKDFFLTNSTSAACVANAQTNLTVKLWRAPIAWQFSVTNTTSAFENAAGEQDPTGATPRTPLAGVPVVVTARPAVLSSDAAICAAGAAAQVDTRTPPLTSAATGTPYVCSAPTDTAGRATLLVPWAELGEYGLKVEAPGYAPHVDTHAFTTADLLTPASIDPAAIDPMDPHAANGLHEEIVVLSRALVDLAGEVIDIHGDALEGAEVTFTQSGETYEAVSLADGTFELALPTGPYDVDVSHPDKEARSCVAQVGVDAAGVATITTDPTYCFQLVATGKAAVIGKVNDDKVAVPIAGLRVCHGTEAAEICDVASADGSWELEIAPSTSLTTNGIRVDTQPKQEWWQFPSSSFTGNSPAAGVILDTETKTANRTRIPVTIRVQNATGDGLPSADVQVMRGAQEIHDDGQTPFQNVTNPQGEHILAYPGRDTSWTMKQGSPQFDFTPYIASASKHRAAGENSTLYAPKASAAFHLTPAMAAHTETLVLDEVAGTFPVAALAWDSHSEEHVNDVPLRAIPGGTGANAPGAGPESLILAPGNFTVYSAFGPYEVCPAPQLLYQDSGAAVDARCATGVTAATGAVNVSLLRSMVDVKVNATDAHTGWKLATYNATFSAATNGVLCEPAQHTGFICGPKNTAATTPYEVTFKVPWTSNANDLCLTGTSRSYLAQPLAAPVANGGENVPFLGASFCQVWEPGHAPYAITVSPLRAPSPNPLNGTVTIDGGAIAHGALVNVSSDRPELRCAPEVHHSGVSPYVDCHETFVNDTGGFSVVVPLAGANTTWRATANLTEHYNETFDHWPNVSGVTGDFVLFPKKFQAIVTIVEQAVGTSVPVSPGCGHQQGYPVWARLKDMQDGDPNPQNVNYRVRAVPQSDTTCLALIEVNGWHRDSQPIPVLLGESWAVTTAPFIASTEHLNHVGYNIGMLGPRDTDRRVTIAMMHLETSTAAAPHTLSGRITDADVLAEISGVAGVPARVSVTPTSASCVTSGANTISDLDGSYSLPVTCPGTYKLTVTPLVATHWEGVTTDVVVADGQAAVTQDMTLERVESTATVTVVKPGFAGPVFIDPKGVDVTADPASARTDASGTVTFAEIPWGIYSFKAGSVVPAQAQTKFVAPGAAAVTVVYV